MQIIRKQAFARAGLMGNPSDGYHGKTISLVVRNRWAGVVLYEWEDLEVVLSQNDHSRFGSIHELVRDVELHGYYGGIRLVKATIKRFAEYCLAQGHALHDRNFSIRYESNIPRQVGMAGSSAIIVATLRCLMEFYDVEIPLPVQPSLALSVETSELGIIAGLQDRVAQVYEGAVFMDFAADKAGTMCGFEHGAYEPLDVTNLPPLYLAYGTHVAEPTERALEPIRTRYNRGEPLVVDAMLHLADLTVQAREAILQGDGRRLGQLIDENFDTRRSIYLHMPQGQLEMVQQARAAGATAKFAGSGGAIIGTYEDESMFQQLKSKLEALGCVVLKPIYQAP
jgi:glucuronokinase